MNKGTTVLGRGPVVNVVCGSLFSEPCGTRIAPLGRDQVIVKERHETIMGA